MVTNRNKRLKHPAKHINNLNHYTPDLRNNRAKINTVGSNEYESAKQLWGMYTGPNQLCWGYKSSWTSSESTRKSCLAEGKKGINPPKKQTDMRTTGEACAQVAEKRNGSYNEVPANPPDCSDV